MRLIDADELIDEFEWCKQQTTECNRKEWDEIITRVSKQPTVDAVPVVRCEDCKHHEVCKNGVNGWCNEHERPTDVTYFCADGERRSDEDQHIYD